MKKRALTILIILAAVLIITAVALQITSSEEVKTNQSNERGSAGKVGVTVLPPQVEDKLIGNTNG